MKFRVGDGVSVVMALLVLLWVGPPRNLEVAWAGESAAVHGASTDALDGKPSASPATSVSSPAGFAPTPQRVGLRDWIVQSTFVWRGLDALQRGHRSGYAGRRSGMFDARRLLRRITQRVHTADDPHAV